MKTKRITAMLLTTMVVATSVGPIFSVKSNATEGKDNSIFERKLSETERSKKIDTQNYYLDAKDFIIGQETGFYSWHIDGEEGITENSVIVYQTDDGVLHEYRAVKREGAKKYSFLIQLDTIGTWKLISIDGQKVTDDLLDIKVHKDEIDLLVEQSSKLIQAIKNEEKRDKEKAEKTAQKTALNITRIQGKDRYQTAVEASKKTFPKGAKYVAIATGENFVDGLVGGAFTSQEGFPLLLVRRNSISKETMDEIKRIHPEKIYIFGGESSVSKEVEKEISKLGIKIERLAGKDRFFTALAIGNARWKAAMPDALVIPEDLALVDGFNFADALTAAPFIAQMRKFERSYYNLGVWVNTLGVLSRKMVFGGTSVIPKGNETYRFAGKTRYETAVAIADAYKEFVKMKPETIVLVSGEDFPDGLTAAEIAGEKRAAVLLTNPKFLNPATKSFIEKNDIKNIIILGGNHSVSESVEKELKELKK